MGVGEVGKESMNICNGAKSGDRGSMLLDTVMPYRGIVQAVPGCV